MGALKPGYEVTNGLTLVRRLGAGGMGTVWLADHAKLGAEVVVKFLSDSLTSDEEARARFSREVAAMVQVRSPHVVQTLDHGITESGVPYIVMEQLEGEDVAKLLKRRTQLRPDEVQHIVEGVAAALTRVHERGIVHRDVKPANVFMCTGSPRAFVKLVDFGIAKRLEDETLTATNAFLGTPTYMSPEQMEGSRDVDHRSDLWSLGVLTYHMLTGTPPFGGAHVANIAHAVFNTDVPSVTASMPELPAAIDAWMARALARDRTLRFGSAQEMADQLAIALGDLAYASTRRLQAPHVVVQSPAALAPTLQAPPSAPLPAAPSAPALVGEGSTFGPSAITQNPRVRPSRTKWWLTAAGVLVFLALGAAFRVGYGLRREDRQPPASAAAVPPGPATTSPLAPPAPPAPLASPTVVATSAPPVASEAPAASTAPRGRVPPRQPSNAKRHGRAAGEDDVGF